MRGSDGRGSAPSAVLADPTDPARTTPGARVADDPEPAGVTRVLALWSPDWPVTAAAMAAHVPPHLPAAVVVANRVLACSAVARAQGVRRGLRRREAQARCPDLAVLARDPDRDARAFEPVVAAVEELAPGVEVVRPGLVALTAQGPAGWFGGEQEAAEALVDHVAARTGVESQVGVADGLFAAVLAARRALAVAPGDTPAFLAPLGVEELDREPDVDRSELVGLLRRLGLRSLGAFAVLDAEDVASRFGADAVHCHRLARGLDPRPPVRRAPPEELAVEIELDPPVDRVDAAAFAARGLAERLHRTLASHGLSCTRLGVAAHTVGGEELHRIWRCAEPLTPAGTVDRVRWQLDAWLTRRRRSGDLPDEAGDGAVARLRLVPEETVTAGALQLGLWGDVGESDERAGRALVRVQALLGPESVVTAVLVGGRDPAEQVRLVPWGDDRGVGPDLGSHSRPIDLDANVVHPKGEEQTWASSGPLVAPAGWPEDVVRRTGRVSAADLPEAERLRTTNRRRRVPTPRRPTGRSAPREPPPSWPGRLPAPSPATVPPQPLPAELITADGSPVLLRAPDLLFGLPASVAVDGGAPRRVDGWAGPWPVQQRWWAPGSAESSRLQVTLDDGDALLLLFREGRWWMIGEYD
ncbi:DNA polymerase Y family protein [Pseudonocardia sp. DSM 110487]|nr:DNA polymerase Y family protein [Pseudonocardia sp. DSM 110487]